MKQYMRQYLPGWKKLQKKRDYASEIKQSNVCMQKQERIITESEHN